MKLSLGTALAGLILFGLSQSGMAAPKQNKATQEGASKYPILVTAVLEKDGEGFPMVAQMDGENYAVVKSPTKNLYYFTDNLGRQHTVQLGSTSNKSRDKKLDVELAYMDTENDKLVSLSSTIEQLTKAQSTSEDGTQFVSHPYGYGYGGYTVRTDIIYSDLVLPPCYDRRVNLGGYFTAYGGYGYGPGFGYGPGYGYGGVVYQGRPFYCRRFRRRIVYRGPICRAGYFGYGW